MSFFESLLLLLLVAIGLLQVSRRLSLPYPAMLAGSGALVALVPGAPELALQPEVSLALFVAPPLVAAAYDFPVHAALRFWWPLVVLAVLAVLATAASVAWLGWAMAGLPPAAAVVLGAIVAPSDAAAAVAVLGAVSIPRPVEAILKGESLFNDAIALLLFGTALVVQEQSGLGAAIVLHLALAAPGGVLLGMLAAMLALRAGRFANGTLGGNLLQFVNVFLAWIVAARLGLSPVLAVVAMGMTLARISGGQATRMRVQSYAVWAAVVFVLNVLAFLMMGLQARAILSRFPAGLGPAARFAGAVLVAVIVTRFAVVLLFSSLARWRAGRRGEVLANGAGAVFVGWSGMRGLVTLATAFALPESFPQRDLCVLTAFAVVLGTLVIQGLTLLPLTRLLGLDDHPQREAALAAARVAMADAALATLQHEPGEEAARLAAEYRLVREQPGGEADRNRRRLGLEAILAERRALEAMRRNPDFGDEAYDRLLEELDWRELSLLPEAERRIEET